MITCLFALADLQNVDANLLGKMYIMVVHWGETTEFQCISDLAILDTATNQ